MADRRRLPAARVSSNRRTPAGRPESDPIMARLKKLFFSELPFSPPSSLSFLMALLSGLGIAGLAYLYGAAVMYFQWPSYDFLDKAFGGAKAWQQRGQSTLPIMKPEEVAAAKKREGISVDKADKTWDGFTLYTMSDGARATLVDMRGNVVHRWELPFSQAWSDPPHVEDPIEDEHVHWFHCYLYPNGDLLALYHADGDTPYGYGLVKVDKDSKLIWKYPNRCHHDVDVGADGTIYTLIHTLVSQPSPGLEYLPAPYLGDSLAILSPEGKELKTIPLAEAFAKSPYAVCFAPDSKPLGPVNHGQPNLASPLPPLPGTPSDQKNDISHANSVKVLNPTLAEKFPLFKAGQVLVSLRNLNTIAVVEPETSQVAWAAEGVWRLQHDAEFLDNGRLLLYDNHGSSQQTRILEYDPRTQAIPWTYSNEDSARFSAFFRGQKQRLPNGNTFIVDPDSRRLFEVTEKKELVWELFCPLPEGGAILRPRSHAINGARRYGKDELTFLKGGPHARP